MFLRPYREIQGRYGSVVFDAEKNQAAAQIGESNDLSGELLRADVVALEFDAGVFAVLDDFKDVVAAHLC